MYNICDLAKPSSSRKVTFICESISDVENCFSRNIFRKVRKVFPRNIAAKKWFWKYSDNNPIIYNRGAATHFLVAGTYFRVDKTCSGNICANYQTLRTTAIKVTLMFLCNFSLISQVSLWYVTNRYFSFT